MRTYDDFLRSSGLSKVPDYWDRRYVKNLDRLSKPEYDVRVEEDVWMILADGTRLSVDIYRPDTDVGKFPSLVAWSAYSKSMQALKRGTIPPKSLIFDHSLEAGDIDFFVKRGYAYVIPDPRGIGKSEGEFYGVYNPREQEDVCDVIEWAAAEPWCSGQVSMIGYSYFGIIQMLAAARKPPHLKCIMPLSFTDDYYQHGYYGGVGTTYLSMYWELCPSHSPVSWSEKLYGPEELKKKIEEVKKDPDIAVNSYFSKILNTWPPRYHTYFLDVLLHSLDGPFWRERSAGEILDKVDVPVYLKCGWSPNGRWSAPVLNTFADPRLTVPKRAGVMESYGGMTLPYRYMNEEQLRWYDHWLKGIDTGIMDEPPLKMNILGAGFRYEHEWPLERTEWRKLYLRNFQELSWDPEPETDVTPDIFVHRPPNTSNEIESLVYTTRPFTAPTEFTGPLTLYLHAALDNEDANIIVKLWDILPGGMRHPVSRYGALKVSHPYVPVKSLPWKPVHDHTRKEHVTPGEVRQYVIEINPIGWVFQPGHSLQLEITSMDFVDEQKSMWTGKVGAMGPIPSADTIAYRIFRDGNHPSYILMPYIPADSTSKDQWLQPLFGNL